MRYLLIILLLTGCAGNWQDFNYAPGDWMAENWGVKVDSPYTYERLLDPEITVHRTEDIMDICGGKANGCAIGNAETCDIYIGTRASESTLAHEKRHCYGWTHAYKETTSIKGYQWYPVSERI